MRRAPATKAECSTPVVAAAHNARSRSTFPSAVARHPIDRADRDACSVDQWLRLRAIACLATVADHAVPDRNTAFPAACRHTGHIPCTADHSAFPRTPRTVQVVECFAPILNNRACRRRPESQDHDSDIRTLIPCWEDN